MIPLARAGAVLAVLCLTSAGLGGCGGQSEADKDREAKESFTKAADLNTCTAEARAADKPFGDEFPDDWPFPPSTVVFNAEDRGATGTIVTGISSADFRQILSFMNKDVGGAGFAIEKGETEKHDAEAEWKGNGFRGRWAIRESASCPGETVIQVLSTSD